MEFNIDLNNINKFFYFCKAGTDGLFNAANDVVCYPVSHFIGFSNLDNTDGTALTMCFSPLQGPLELAANAYPKVISEIIGGINSPIFRDNGIVVVADSMNE